MFDRKILKKRAKYVLSRSYPTSVLACLITLVLSGVMSISSGFNAGGNGYGGSGLNQNFLAATTLIAILVMAVLVLVVAIFLSGPIKVGLKNFMLCASFGDARMENLFKPFKEGYGNAVWVSFVKNLYIFLWSLLGLIPIICGVCFFDIHEKIYALLKMQSPDITSIMSLGVMVYGVLILCIIFLVPSFIKRLQFSLVDYILAENPGIKANEAVYKSKELMVGNKWAAVKLRLSFLPWYLITSFVCCGLGNVLLAPYVEQTFCQMYLEICGRGKDFDFDTVVFGGRPFGF